MMPIRIYAHPFSSYCQKVLIALYENDTPFEFRLLAGDDEQTASEHEQLWPLKRMPVLVDGDRTVVEASIIIEYLGLHHPGRLRFLPESPAAALEVRMMDRFFDNYVMTPMQKIVLDHIRGGAGPRLLRRGRCTQAARRLLSLAQRQAARPYVGRGWRVQHGGLRRRACAVLC